MKEQVLTENSQIVLLLCSYLARKTSDYDTHAKPLTAREWHLLRRVLEDGGFQSPSALFSINSSVWEGISQIKKESLTYERIETLIRQSGRLALELEDLYQKGIWVLTEYDDDYPDRFSKKLKEHAPPFIFGAGNAKLLSQGGLAIVGSRNVDDNAIEFTKNIAALCAENSLNVISGAARGIDSIAMLSALQNRGHVVGVLADSLEKFILNGEIRDWILDDKLVAMTHTNPSAGFDVGIAMSRNKFIYSLADYALVVSSDKEKGGTWAGAVEALKNNYNVIFVRDGENIPDGNKALLKKGCVPFPENFDGDLIKFLENNSNKSAKTEIKQMELGFQ